MFKVLIPLAAAAAFATSANALTITEEPGSNLASFSYTVVGNVITLNEGWDTGTSANVILRFDDFDYGINSWVIVKNVTNNTGVDMTEFSHELLQSDQGGSPNNDGLSFAQFGVPQQPRTSDSFSNIFADEIDTRDYLNFNEGVILDGGTGQFSYGLTARRDTEETNPFFLRQKAQVIAVPEPATWGMMILGFGLVGFAMRRRAAIASITA